MQQVVESFHQRNDLLFAKTPPSSLQYCENSSPSTSGMLRSASGTNFTATPFPSISAAAADVFAKVSR
jgi:hypothetical protein